MDEIVLIDLVALSRSEKACFLHFCFTLGDHLVERTLHEFEKSTFERVGILWDRLDYQFEPQKPIGPVAVSQK